MLYLLVGLGALFVFVGFIVTKKNAPYLLSGYNTMSKEEQAKVNLDGLLAFMKTFHLFLGISFSLIGIGIYFYGSEKYLGLFMSLYPILCYLYFIWKSQRFYESETKKRTIRFALIILVISAVTIFIITEKGFRENVLEISDAKIKITGMYGETISLSDIEHISLIDTLPQITKKVNGFAVKEFKKGIFKTSEGEKVTLILNTKEPPFILLQTEDTKLYFSSKSYKTDSIYLTIKNHLNN